MITEAFPKLNDARPIKAIRAFFASPWYPALIVLLTVCSELFALELYLYWTYLFFVILTVLVAEDTLPIVPMALCGYVSVSAVNNPGKREDTIFHSASSMTQLFVIVLFIAVFLIARFVSKLIYAPRRGVPRLTAGFVFLAAAYLLGGVASKYYGGRTVLFGLAQILSLSFAYFYFYFTIDWEKVKKEYLMFVVFLLGLGVAVEAAGMYFHAWVNLENIKRESLYTGWGIYNNVGCILAMCIPAAFYFAATRKEGWIFTVIGTAMAIALVFTQSRGSILFGLAVYLICAVMTLVKTKGKARVKQLAVFIVLIATLAVCAAVMRERLSAFFKTIIELGTNSLGRNSIYKACWGKFQAYPFFGVGFYETPGGLLIDGNMLVLKPCPDDVFLPPRSHNTFFQLLASGGIFAILAYLLHRIETIIMLFRRPTCEKSFAAMCILALLLTSLVDCHLFNFGPAIFYSVLLVFAEGENKKRRSKEKAAA